MPMSRFTARLRASGKEYDESETDLVAVKPIVKFKRLPCDFHPTCVSDFRQPHSLVADEEEYVEKVSQGVKYCREARLQNHKYH